MLIVVIGSRNDDTPGMMKWVYITVDGCATSQNQDKPRLSPYPTYLPKLRLGFVQLQIARAQSVIVSGCIIFPEQADIPHPQMLIRGHDLSLSIRIHHSQPLGRLIPFLAFDILLDLLARHNTQLGPAVGMTKVRDRIPRPSVLLPFDAVAPLGEDNPVHSAPEQATSPVREQVTNVNQDRRRRIVLRSWRDNRHRSPVLHFNGSAIGVGHGRGAGADLKAGLAAQTEEQSQRTVVGVSARTNVCVVVRGRVGRRRGVVQEAQNAAGGTG